METNKEEKIQKLHQRMIEEIQDYAIILLDADGTILTWNKGAQKIKGYTEAEILGQNFRLFYLPLDRQAQLPEALLNQAIKEGRAKHIGRRLRKDGSTFWGRIVITAIHDDDGTVIGFTKLTTELLHEDED
ncbi:PAS domain-containing protein [Desertivirga brevis]|uniref:PAS domain-containing protein n=1 Tax=Desertivirga brevis TaxID=2810310 RepID=UPI001A9694EC|nr:PAS domain-containing protein [Pedobacter sp. SYSU D00873]